MTYDDASKYLNEPGLLKISRKTLCDAINEPRTSEGYVVFSHLDAICLTKAIEEMIDAKIAQRMAEGEAE